MSNLSIPQLIGDVVLREETEEDRTRAAVDIISYGLAALVTLQGPKAAAETAYRCADAVVRSIA
jgi:hypothetical protein